MSASRLPLEGVRVHESSNLPAARLAGLLLADQGAEVWIRRREPGPREGIDDYLDRGKIMLPVGPHGLVADIILGDGEGGATHPGSGRAPWQISIGFPVGAPGDPDIDLPEDASDDLLNAMIGFYTDLGVTSRLLGRDVIYTPVPLCTVYAAVLGAVAASAALADRLRSGSGRTIAIPRLAAGLSAIGVLAMQLEGVEPHLVPPGLLTLPPGLAAELPKARGDAGRMLSFLNCLNPTAGCYRTADDRLVMPVATVNRRLAVRMFETLGLWERIQAAGIVDLTPYDPASRASADRNAAVPQAIASAVNVQLAGWIQDAFAGKTALEWEALFASAQVPCGIVRDFEEWMRCDSAHESGLVEPVEGLMRAQLGRAVSLRSAKPYPALQAARDGATPPVAGAPENQDARPYEPPQPASPSRKPLAGYVVLDLANVIAGPACGRLLGELGASVFKLDTMRPDHQPLVTVVWGAEANQGKASILADLRSSGGRAILERLVKMADIVVMNATDSGARAMGLSQPELARINPRAIGIQLSAFKGPRPADHDDHPGYDPLLQAVTGIMTRFGSTDLPLMHGIASCVDYLTGYLAAFGGLLALFAREQRRDGRGDWVDTSLASAASLAQFPFQWGPVAPTAAGPSATGPSATARLHQLTDGWIFAEATTDLAPDLDGLEVNAALALMRAKGVRAARVCTIAALREHYRRHPSPTIRFRTTQRQGLKATLLEPTWFQFDGQPLTPTAEPGRPGGDADGILTGLGYSGHEIVAMRERQAVGEADWRHLAAGRAG